MTMPRAVGSIFGSTKRMATLAYLSLGVIFVLDAVTPQALSIQIAYEASVVLAALTAERKLIVRLIFLALTFDLLGALADAMQDNFIFDPIGIENRIISLTSIFLVGALALVLQSKSQALGRAEERRERERLDGLLLAAVYRFWSSLQPQHIEKTVTEEAVPIFSTSEAIWCPSDVASPMWARFGEATEATLLARPPLLPAAITALATVASLRTTETFPADASLAALIGNRSLAPYYLGIAIADEQFSYGVLFIATAAAAASDATARVAREYALRARAAMQQTRLLERLRQRNEALAGRQHVMEELVEAISHDVRTPLLALSITLEQALDGAYGALPAPYASVLKESRSSIDGIQRLAETLLLVARFEAETPRDQPQRVHLSETVRDVAAELGPLAEAGGLTVRTAAPADAIIDATGSDVRRAIANLLANAIHNTPRGGTIEIAVTQKAAAVELAVIDDGYGVPAGLRPSLFQRFSKAAGDGGGTGLGLYIVRRVAEESGGHASYEERQPHGSKFTIAFPTSANVAA